MKLSILIKNLLFQIKNRRNRISLNSDISLNTKIGAGNLILKSTVYNSKVSDNCQLSNSSLHSSSIGNNSVLNDATLYAGNIANDVNIGRNTVITSSSVKRYSYFAGNNRIFNSNIGAFCSIAENVTIGHAEHPYTHFSTSPVFYKKNNPFNSLKFLQNEIQEFSETIIGNDVWIGLNAYVKSGITIGDGSIIGAGSVVTKNVPPYSIMGGVPAKEIKKRFNEERIAKLTKDRWWDLSDEDLLKYLNKNW